MKKNILFLGLCAAINSSGVFALDATAWQREQSFEVSTSGITRLELPAETLNVSRAGLKDLRLLSPSGVETPYILERFSLTPPREAAVRTFKSNFIEGDGGTVVELETGSAEPIEAVILDSPAANFLKAARLEGSNDGAQWHELAKNEVIFRQPNGASRLRIPFTSASYGRLRITLNDSRSEPVPFTAARIEFTRQKQALVSQGVSITRTEEKPRESVLTVNLGAANLHLAHLRLTVSDPVFSRRIRVSYVRDDNGKPQNVPVSSAVIYRVTTNDGLSTAWLDVPVHQQVPISEITVTIENGDSPPLKVSGLEATRQPVTAIFFAQENGTWKLLTGNRTAIAPSYDLASLDVQLRQGNAAKLIPGELTTNPNYKAPPALPQLTAQGVEIDLKKWRYHKPIAVTEAGVIQVELDAEVLAHAQSSFADLRLIQNGRQLPWQLEPTNATRTLQPAVIKESDPNRPNVSLWRITMPLDGLPALRLTCTSPTALFQRNLTAWSKHKDSETRSPLGSTMWQNQTNGAPQKLFLEFPRTRLPETFFLETDNGDNPPIDIEAVQVEYPLVTLAAKLTETAPVFLYYGNDQVAMPNYDLRLVRQELLSATKHSVKLGAEDYHVQPVLPQVSAQGVEIDLTKWHYRKPLAVAKAGVIRVEFDTEVLARTQSSFGDVRLIQDGRQIPWQLDPTNATKMLQPALVKESDPKRPTVSLWRITMPIDDLPALRLTCTSPTELFERRISAWSKRKDSMGNEYRSSLGATQWVHQKSGAQQSLNFGFQSTRLPETFFLETDNGDNPPIDIADIKVEYAVVTLAAKLTETTPVFLYYGNDRAAMPSYDLRLVRNELLSATKQSAELGAEEKLLADKRSTTPGEVSAGSPWLWVALAAVIVALLWVVAKMLPKPEEGGEGV